MTGFLTSVLNFMMAQSKPSTKKVLKKKRSKLKYPDEMYEEFDEIIYELCEMGKIFNSNFLYDSGRWTELRCHSVMWSTIWDTPLAVLDYCFHDISSLDATIISKQWRKHKKTFKRDNNK